MRSDDAGTPAIACDAPNLIAGMAIALAALLLYILIRNRPRRKGTIPPADEIEDENDVETRTKVESGAEAEKTD